MTALKTLVAAAASCLVSGAALANSSGPTLLDRQQAACFDDAMRLCGQYVPNVDATKACMKTKKKLVSPECAAFYPPSSS